VSNTTSAAPTTRARKRQPVPSTAPQVVATKRGKRNTTDAHPVVPPKRSRHAEVPTPEPVAPTRANHKRAATKRQDSPLCVEEGPAVDISAGMVMAKDSYDLDEYVVCAMNSDWFLGKVIFKDDDGYEVDFLVKNKVEETAFKWPAEKNILPVIQSEILGSTIAPRRFGNTRHAVALVLPRLTIELANRKLRKRQEESTLSEGE
jgi:hypothetical protein